MLETTNMLKLKPCPFCGSEAERDSGMFLEFGGHEHQDSSVGCTECGAEIVVEVGSYLGATFPCSCCYPVREAVDEAWNRRVIC